jgi:hypothetical protein
MKKEYLPKKSSYELSDEEIEQDKKLDSLVRPSLH